jgi:anhydro-N-acetylmuramic acid kinase
MLILILIFSFMIANLNEYFYFYTYCFMRKSEFIGLMSGTSLDGLDIVHVSFFKNEVSEDKFEILHTQSVDFPNDLKAKIETYHQLSIAQIFILDKEIGQFFGKAVNNFLAINNINPTTITAIASHGQTILHQPKNGFTLQIGCGTTIASITGINVINDFRTRDIVEGGQGAPLVPVGDFGLFKNEAEAFLNIGGFANFSYQANNSIYAYDICPGNLPLNKLANAKNLDFDKNGDLAKAGEINFFLLDLLNSLDFYSLDGPKSLGTEWLDEFFYPLLKFDKEIENNLRTVVEHIALQISTTLNGINCNKVFITGGGAKNSFLIERIQHYFKGEILIPSADLIDFKEALIFAYLGFLYKEKSVNALSSVTGAKKDTVGGVFHLA